LIDFSQFLLSLMWVYCRWIVLQEDDDSHYIALQMIQDLMLKSRDSFLDYFAQLGIFRKVLNLCGPQSDDEEDKVSHHWWVDECCHDDKV